MHTTKWNTQVKKGLLELCLLNILAKEALHGYEIVKRITAIPNLEVTAGTIYPLLTRLRKEGLLRCELEEISGGPPKKNFYLTPDGEAQLTHMNATWQDINTSVAAIMHPNQTEQTS